MLDQIQAILATPWGNGLAVGLLTVWPAMRILRRAGQPPALAALVFLPLIGVLALLVMLTLRRWPDPRAPASDNTTPSETG